MAKVFRPNQTTMFDTFDESSIEPPAIAASETSVEAAKQIEPAAISLRAQLLNWLKERNDGATDEEMQIGVPMDPSTQRPRRGELVRLGLVRDSGTKRKTRSGRLATVWETEN